MWKDSTHPSFLIYLLEHSYTDTNLAAPRLTGNDATRVRIAEDVASEMGFICYLGNLKQKTWEFDNDEESCSEEQFSDYECYSRSSRANEKIVFKITTSVTDLEGKVLVPKLKVEEQDFIKAIPLDGGDYEDDFCNDDNALIYRSSVSCCDIIKSPVFSLGSNN